MRRKDREITDLAEIREIIDAADVCRIAFADGNFPYIVTLNFGYEWNDRLTLYFHCAKQGRKLDLMKKNNTVCFEMDIGHALKRGNAACDWGMSYRSIVGYGTLSSVNDPQERTRALDRVMDHYGFTGDKVYDEKVLPVTEVLKLVVSEMTGKRKG
jgi:nitroimidazol reductase NimA-like FMN-containing flavoprotein (pyridoxamine 5'-phosphate oxidase superfamily)